MTERTLLVGPFNRVEGDLEIRLTVEDDHVAAAYCNSPMFLGFEPMLQGKAPLDALTITPRIRGIYSISQSAAAAAALGAIAGQPPAPRGALVAALLHGIENGCDHITHFNLFFGADFARSAYAGRAWHGLAVERFTAMEGSAVRQCVEARAQLLHIMGLLGGKWPQTLAIQPGGVTRAPTARDRIRIATTLRAFRRYLEDVLFGAPVEAFAGLSTGADLWAWSTDDAGLFMEIAADLRLDQMGAGPGRYMSFGAYPLPEGCSFGPGLWENGVLKTLDTDDIIEDVSHAWMVGDAAHPTADHTVPDEEMADPGYSWCQALRPAGRTVETGAFARQVVDGHAAALALACGRAGVTSRVAGRLLEIARMQVLLEDRADAIVPEAHFMDSFEVPRQGSGADLVEVARGALEHWVSIADGAIDRYQIIAPTTWNFSPCDASGLPARSKQRLCARPSATAKTRRCRCNTSCAA